MLVSVVLELYAGQHLITHKTSLNWWKLTISQGVIITSKCVNCFGVTINRCIFTVYYSRFCKLSKKKKSFLCCLVGAVLKL